MEALACGLPVITTAQNGASELMTDGRQGYVLTTPNAQGELIAALHHMTEDSRRKAMSAEAARLGAEQTFDRHVAALVKVFQEVAAAKNSHGPHGRNGGSRPHGAAAKARKNIFVEKPLALNESDLNQIVSLYEKKLVENFLPKVLVGYNRRFAPLMKEIKKFFSDIKDPLIVNYRVNAGFLPKSHWTQDTVEGGGRIIGEVCHFIDIVQFLTGSNPDSVFAQSISSSNDNIINNDNINIILKMENGSMGIITYLANGDKSVAKERLEVTGGNQYAILDNFENVHLFKNERKISIKGKGIDKGHKNEIKEFIQSIVENFNLIKEKFGLKLFRQGQR